MNAKAQRVEELRKQVDFSPAFDRRDPNPSKNYGIHGVDMRMYLIGDSGAVQFVLFTNWYLPHVQDELIARGRLTGPVPADLGYHSKRPMYEGHETSGDCNVIGCNCYYDGSGLNAERIMDVLLREGGDAVWRELKAYYEDVFKVGAVLAGGRDHG
jgi:hypothetical protein